jgi:hypothetical protein
MNNASRYLSRLATEIRTPQQRLKNLKVLLKLTSDLADGRVSYGVAKFVSDRIDALDNKAEQQGVQDPIASTFQEAPVASAGRMTRKSRDTNTAAVKVVAPNR